MWTFTWRGSLFFGTLVAILLLLTNRGYESGDALLVLVPLALVIGGLLGATVHLLQWRRGSAN